MVLRALEPVSEVVLPELAAPAPRRLRLPFWTAAAIGAAAAGYALAIAAACGIARRSVEIMDLAHGGAAGSARIIACSVEPANEPAGDPFIAGPPRPRLLRVRFVFRAGGRDAFGSTQMYAAADGPGSAASLVGRRLPIRWALVGGRAEAAPTASLRAVDARTSIAAALIIGAAATWLMASGCAKFRRLAMLARYGIVLVATVCDKEIVEGDGPGYFVTYGYLDIRQRPQRRRERCTVERWRSLRIGDPVAVLAADDRQPPRMYASLPVRCRP